VATNVVDSIVQPDESAIKAHLELLFAPLREEYPGGIVELRYGAGFKSAYFNLRTDGLADCAVFAEARARAGDNIYVGVNPRKPSTDTRKAASDSDVEVSAWQFADIDKAESLQALGRKLRPLPPTFTVDTGTTPHRRPHLYWQLEELVWNMASWTERQRGIAQTLGGDSVINPSRIMRLAGSVNFPPQHKLQRGYALECTSMRTEFEDEREPVTPDEVATAFPATLNSNDGNDLLATGGQTPAGQTTLSQMRRTRIQDLIDACCRGDEWHNNMIRLVAHLAALGRTSAEILALADHITLPGFTADQSRREMAAALQGARTKWALPEPSDEPVEHEEALREEGDSIFDLFDLDQLEAMPPPTWLIHEMLAEEGLTVLYGDPGAGKSFIAIDMALRIAHGMDWHGAAAGATGVLYIAGEGVRGLGKRVKGWRKEHDMDGVDAPFLLVPAAVQILDPKQREKLIRTISAAIERAGFAIGLIIIDTVSRALAGADENGQEAMSAFVAACDEVRRHAGGALLGVHHSGKDKDRGMRGSTVLLGACDASIRVSKSDHTVTLKTEKQKDAEEAAPIYMEMRKVSWATGLEEEQTTLVPFRSEAPADPDKETLSQEQIVKVFGLLADAWGAKKPFSVSPQTKSFGRYAPRLLARVASCSEATMTDYLGSWIETGCLEIAQYDSNTKARGIRVLDMPGEMK
jgi:hypothetical protein